MISENYIYHYTSRKSLEEILNSKTLKLSSCQNYKDSEAEAEALKKVIYFNLEKSNKFRESLHNFIRHLQNSEYLNNNQLTKEIIKLRANSYMVCFSKIKDNCCLWRKYAEKCSGVVLAFDKIYLTSPSYNVTSFDSDGRLTEVRWIDEMKYGEEIFVNSVVNSNIKDNNFIFEIDAYKDEKYEDEQESRLVAYISNSNLLGDLRLLHIDKEVNNKKIVRHFGSFEEFMGGIS